MPGFVIEYHRPTGDRRVYEFPGETGHQDALQFRLQLEGRRLDADWEIASLNSDSLATLRKTHARYFTGQEVQHA